MPATTIQNKRDNMHPIRPEILELLELSDPAPSSGPYTSLMRCNGEPSFPNGFSPST
jgi:hypothetical protein